MSFELSSLLQEGMAVANEVLYLLRTGEASFAS